jgi:hypothetical protein
MKPMGKHKSDPRAEVFHEAARAIFGRSGDFHQGVGRIEAEPTFDELSRLAEACGTRLIDVRGIETGGCETCAGVSTVIEVRWER